MSTGPMAGLDPCVHCGFCLQACPTYVETGDEADGPRGRIVLMRGLDAGIFDANDKALVTHLDRCLGCRACETACPSGVQYGVALEEARRQIVCAAPLSPLVKAVLTVMAEPRLRRPLMWLARAARPFANFAAGRSAFGFMMGMLAATKPVLGRTGARAVSLRSREKEVRTDPGVAAEESTGGSPDRLTALFRGCIMEGIFSHVHAATERVLRKNNFALVKVANQGCCGALHAHAGDADGAKALARANVAAFDESPEATIVVNSAGCGATLKAYGHLLAGDPLEERARVFAGLVRDVAEVLADAGPTAGGELPMSVAYDAPCHLHHAQRVTDAPRRLLEAIPGLRIIEHEEPDQCCGSAGLYSLVQREMSRAVLDRKIAALRAANPDVVASGNPGCVMHIGAGMLAERLNIPVVHPVELLDASYRRAGVAEAHAHGSGPSARLNPA